MKLLSVVTEPSAFMDENTLIRIFEECRVTQDYQRLRAYLVSSLNTPQFMKKSFLSHSDEKIGDDDDLQHSFLKERRQSVDLNAVRRCVGTLKALPEEVRAGELLLIAFYELFRAVEFDVRTRKSCQDDPTYANVFFIALEFREAVGVAKYREVLLGSMLSPLIKLGPKCGSHLATVLCRLWDREILGPLVNDVHQFITDRILINLQHGCGSYVIDADVEIVNAVMFLKILYTASWMGGTACRPASLPPGNMDRGEHVEMGHGTQPESRMNVGFLEGAVEVSNFVEQRQPPWDQPINTMYLHEPILPPEDFYNRTLSENLVIERELARFHENLESEQRGQQPKELAFLSLRFLVTPEVKAAALHMDHRITMYEQRRSNMVAAMLQGEPHAPYLKVKVRREHVVEDALVHLLTAALEDPSVLKKQLMVEFDEEQAVDEGGVSKEFFQLVIEEICDPKYGLFVYNAETRTHWFNSFCTDCQGHYTLMGILGGLAIYNNVLLDLQLPLVVYRKLMGKIATWRDMEDYDPVLFRSLKQLLEYEGEDIEDVFEQTFQVSYSDCFGTLHTTQLVPNGNEIKVNHENKRDFVSRYAHFLLNESIEMQFKPFEQGFRLVARETQISNWFSPEEVELLVRGTADTDFAKLEGTVQYEGGYCREDAIIRWFWALVHGMTDDEKMDLMRFVTGSHRIPMGGFEKLKFAVMKNGANPDLLPSAHTCYNVLLLPEYSSEDILRDRLMKALTFCKGFGLL